MNGIIGMAELMSHTSLNAEQKDYLDTMRESAQTLMGLINDILDFSKIEAGKMQLEKTHLDIRDIVQTTIKMLEVQAQAKGLQLVVDIDSRIKNELSGDPLRLKQVLINLINNAIKFSSDGRVYIFAKLKDETNSKSRIYFSVSDQGVGFDSEVAQKLFKPFVQGEVGTTRRFGGTGLGLAICKQLVELMDGSIGADSIVGEGSTFWFEVCLDHTVEKPVALVEKQQALMTNTASHILVAEDNVINQKVVANMLDKMGYTFEIAADGNEAVEHVLNQDYDLILMDCHMPVLDGYEATKKIRLLDDPIKSHTPIIAFTANTMASDIEKCLSVGMNDYLPKPMTMESLVQKIEEWSLNTHGLDAQTASKILDLTALRNLQSSVDQNNSFIKELAEIFKKTALLDIKEMKKNQESQNYDQVKFFAHRLKSSCANLGAYPMKSLCESIEQDTKEQRYQELEEKICKLELLREEAVLELQSFLKSA